MSGNQDSFVLKMVTQRFLFCLFSCIYCTECRLLKLTLMEGLLSLQAEMMQLSHNNWTVGIMNHSVLTIWFQPTPN